MKEFLKGLFEKKKQLPIPKKDQIQQQQIAVESSNSSEKKKKKFPFETPEEIILENHEKESNKPLNGGCNKTEFVEIKDDGSGIFKPKNGEDDCGRRNVKAGSYFRRERASYIIDKFLRFNLVPPTVIREIDGEIGSLQQFIPDAQTGFETSRSELILDKILCQQLIKLWIFDYIIYNSDRHQENFLVKLKEKKIYAIDHGLSFGNDYLKFYEEFFETPIPLEISDGIERFLSWKEGKELCEELLEELISPEEVKACMRRIERILKIIKNHGKIPRSAKNELVF
ncbi:MAG: hypothetical protein COV30_00790 [Candidatus Yanofskybacteria bacterium CG10_big_fil_rev_8_21_14_0_10_37_15]|uniref:PI3K/PI4K catalytic domain-containing protein n=1 Tax=Candidatus Yanofskybacteria bacterium CG10_big_fil_rev_8_21_14_0_10_37_15 TaxID=1975097 RepID=A0A2H0R664_9BACT|nr:MAG: hypothetical protein COV30_00790 [Candidatus Yanofskybacteria bacterium CG10_big_fil_rev_8_21_14_0_10_37_15]